MLSGRASKLLFIFVLLTFCSRKISRVADSIILKIIDTLDLQYLIIVEAWATLLMEPNVFMPAAFSDTLRPITNKRVHFYSRPGRRNSSAQNMLRVMTIRNSR
jgi:hypothetical protein